MTEKAKQQCDITSKWFKEDFGVDVYNIYVCDNGTTFSGGTIIVDGNKAKDNKFPTFYYGYEISVVYNI